MWSSFDSLIVVDSIGNRTTCTRIVPIISTLELNPVWARLDSIIQTESNDSAQFLFLVVEWLWMAPSPADLPRPLLGHSIAFVRSTSTLYIFSGQRDDWRRGANSARSEAFALRFPEGDWERLAPMPLGRSQFFIVADDHFVHIIGGSDEALSQRQDVQRQWFTADRYDI